MGNLQLQPITYREAKAFVHEHHRHHRPPQGWLFGTAASDGGRVIGVVMVGRPVARHLDDGWTAEVTRLCVLPDCRNACSLLYAAAWRAARSLGYRQLITYTLASESGVSLRAAGWQVIGRVKGRTWHRASRPRVDNHPTTDKVLWEAVAG